MSAESSTIRMAALALKHGNITLSEATHLIARAAEQDEQVAEARRLIAAQDAPCWTHHVDGEHNWHKIMTTGRIVCWTCEEKDNA